MTDPDNLDATHERLMEQLEGARSRSLRARLQSRLACVELWRELLTLKQGAEEELERRQAPDHSEGGQ